MSTVSRRSSSTRRLSSRSRSSEPWRRASIFNNSPIAKIRVAGVPAITVAAVVTGAFLVFNLVMWFTDSTYGVGFSNPNSIKYLAIIYVAALVVYVGFFLYQRRQGIDLRAI